MKTIREIILSNRAWSEEMRERNPAFFTRQTAGQKPELLWIGCSDSRVNPERITQTRPGELFIHRNIANIVHADDTNFQAVLQYALDVLKVPHIVLCGHHGCGGIAATLQGGTEGAIDDWLSGSRAVLEAHRAEIDAMPDGEERLNRLVELNVRDQLVRLAGFDLVRAAFARGQDLTLHGWVYDLRTGHVSELLAIGADDNPDAARIPAKVVSAAT